MKETPDVIVEAGVLHCRELLQYIGKWLGGLVGNIVTPTLIPNKNILIHTTFLL